MATREHPDQGITNLYNALERERIQVEKAAGEYCDRNWHKAGRFATEQEMQSRREMFDKYLRDHGW